MNCVPDIACDSLGSTPFFFSPTSGPSRFSLRESDTSYLATRSNPATLTPSASAACMQKCDWGHRTTDGPLDETCVTYGLRNGSTSCSDRDVRRWTLTRFRKSLDVKRAVLDIGAEAMQPVTNLSYPPIDVRLNEASRRKLQSTTVTQGPWPPCLKFILCASSQIRKSHTPARSTRENHWEWRRPLPTYVQ